MSLAFSLRACFYCEVRSRAKPLLTVIVAALMGVAIADGAILIWVMLEKVAPADPRHAFTYVLGKLAGVLIVPSLALSRTDTALDPFLANGLVGAVVGVFIGLCIVVGQMMNRSKPQP